MSTTAVAEVKSEVRENSVRCSEPGCIWPQYEDGICLKHLREREDPLPFTQLETVSLYSNVGNVSYGLSGVRARSCGLRIYDSEE